MLLPAVVQHVPVIARPAQVQAHASSATPVIFCIKMPVYLPAQMVIIAMFMPAIVQGVQVIAQPAEVQPHASNAALVIICFSVPVYIPAQLVISMILMDFVEHVQLIV